MTATDSAPAERRFAILHHLTATGEHWDLLLEREQKCWAWQLDRNPAEAFTGAVAATDRIALTARRIFDHRKLYLDYEGPISGNRGSVTQVDAGTCEFDHDEADLVVVRLSGRHHGVRLELRLLGRERWSCAGEANP